MLYRIVLVLMIIGYCELHPITYEAFLNNESVMQLVAEYRDKKIRIQELLLEQINNLPHIELSLRTLKTYLSKLPREVNMEIENIF